MDKQKQIEGMIELMADWALRNNMCWHEGHAKALAETFAENGYRKIPEGAVVLTREEYSDYLVMKDAHQNAIERCEKLQADNERLYKNIGKFKDAVRKETAEKFAEKLKEIAGDKLDLYGWRMVYINDIDKICKEITEGEKG